MSLICRIFRHRWEVIDDHTEYCLRCRQVKARFDPPERKPVSELDKIIHDRDWYEPKKREVKKNG